MQQRDRRTDGVGDGEEKGFEHSQRILHVVALAYEWCAQLVSLGVAVTINGFSEAWTKPRQEAACVHALYYVCGKVCQEPQQ